MSMNDLDQMRATEQNARIKALTSTREFAFTSFKEFTGRDGYGFSANVTRNGQSVGDVIDEGNGGSPFLRVPREDRTAFAAEARSFYGDDAEDWLVEEGYISILALVADISRKRSLCVSTEQHSLADGVYLTLTGSTKDLAAAADYLLSPQFGLADQNPMIWVKAESRFVPATDLTA